MTHLNEGDKAPDFTGIDQNGNTISLADFSGKKLVLYFYPKDDTPGCTAEACNLRDNHQMLLSKGIDVVGVSADIVAKHLKFSEKYDLPFPLLADTDRHIISAYGVWGKKKFMGREFDGIHRETFVINEYGKIVKIFYKVNTKAHAEEILKALGI
jgi:peroxiredoxin Q/BCP